jgi:hypothetical protein
MDSSEQPRKSKEALSAELAPITAEYRHITRDYAEQAHTLTL